MKRNLIYLAGFMGSGKSTIGPILANTLGWEFYDLDKEIEQLEGKKVREIFHDAGESYFRTRESAVLENLSRKNNLIIALGGGTISIPSNLDLMKRSGKIIYLKASPESIYPRLKFKTDRPMFVVDGMIPSSKEEFMEKIVALMNKRIKYYEKADLTVSTDQKDIGKTVDEIARIILKRI